MNKIKCWSISAVLILLMQTAYSQKNAYIATDSTLSSGIKLIQGTHRDNAQIIRLKRKNEEIGYSAEELTEYGFKNGTIYESKSISVSGQTKQVFLERLEHGKISLFFYTEKGIKTFFLERDSTVFIEINKGDNYRKIISEYTNDFAWKANQVLLVKYNRKSLSKLISLYNNDRNKPLPFPRLGIITGFKSTSLSVPSSISVEQLEGISFNPSPSLSFGVFGDLPIEMSDFSLNVGVNFSKSGFSVSSISSRSDVDVVINISSIDTPVLLRYTIPTLVWRPFIIAGGIYSYHLKNESEIYESSIDQNVITIHEVIQESLISEGMLGYSFGIGLQRNLNYKKIASVEFRFNQLYGNKNTLNKNQFEMMTSFSF
ncbi:MAG: PorT family protein [Reichenbachiella sp.]